MKSVVSWKIDRTRMSAKMLLRLLRALALCMLAAGRSVAAPVAPASLPTGYVAPALPRIPDKNFKITDFGALGDGRADDAKAIQAAIDAAGAAGGGVVEAPAGDFLCGPIRFANRIELHLDSGAILKMLPLDSYPGGSVHPENFISAKGLHDIAISGPGTIDGQGLPWWPLAKDKTAKRPRMIEFSACERVLIEQVTVMNSPMFHIAIGGKSSDVTVRGVTIRANPSTDPVHPSHNTDACDVSAKHVLIENCDVSVGDDNFTCAGGTSDVLITGCAYGYGHGVSIGSYTSGEISDITVENCTFTNTEFGIRLKSDRDRGGNVHGLVYRNLQMTNVGCPILIYCAYMAQDRQFRRLNDLTPDIAATYPSQPVTSRTPNFHDISFIKITATAASGRRAGLIWGLPESPVSHVLFQNVAITADKPFGVYSAKEVRLVNSKITTPEGLNKLSVNDSQIGFANN